MSLPALIKRYKESRQRADLYSRWEGQAWTEDAYNNAIRSTKELRGQIRALLPDIDIDELLEVLCDD